MKLVHILPFVLVTLVLSCGKESKFKLLPEGPINHHLIVLGKNNNQVSARGFSHATPPDTDIFCEIGKANVRVKSSADGSFFFDIADVSEDLSTGEFTFTVGGKVYQQGYQIRDLPSSLKKMTKEAFDLDKEVSAISFFDEQVAILSSSAALVRIFGVDKYFRPNDQASSAVLLSKDESSPLFPSSVTALKEHVAVPLTNAHEIALIDAKKGELLARARVQDDHGQPFRFPVNPPLTLRNPIDAAETGTATTNITQSSPRNPEYIFALDNEHFLASYSNYYQFDDASQGQKSVVGPGVVALFAIEDGKLKTKAREVLPFKNPRHFVAKDAENVWLVASGVWSSVGTSSVASTDAGLIHLKISADKKSIRVERTLALTDFSPAIPALLNGKIVIPHYERSEVLVIDDTATSYSEIDKKKPNFHRDFGFTFAAHWHDDIVLLGDKQGTLVAFSLANGYFPFPFVEPIILDNKVDERIGLRSQMIYFRQQVEKLDIKAHAPEGYSAWVVTDTHQKIYPMDFLEVFGP